MKAYSLSILSGVPAICIGVAASFSGQLRSSLEEYLFLTAIYVVLLLVGDVLLAVPTFFATKTLISRGVAWPVYSAAGLAFGTIAGVGVFTLMTERWRLVGWIAEVTSLPTLQLLVPAMLTGVVQGWVIGKYLSRQM